MIRIIALHAKPADPEAFDAHYNAVHTPLVQRIPGVRNIRYGRVLQNPDTRNDYHLMCDVIFDDENAFREALGSPEMADALADVPNFSDGGVSIFYAEFEDYPPVGEDPNRIGA